MLDYAAFPQQRQALICQILQENGRVVCAELAARLQVSEHTIRRDLHELSREGFCKKVYGGAVLSLPEAGDYSQRKDKNRAIKLRIAQQCARLVKPGGTIFIDTGTTNLAMAEALPAELALTVVTNSPEIAAVLVKKPLYDVVMLGGLWARFEPELIRRIERMVRPQVLAYPEVEASVLVADIVDRPAVMGAAEIGLRRFIDNPLRFMKQN